MTMGTLVVSNDAAETSNIKKLCGWCQSPLSIDVHNKTKTYCNSKCRDNAYYANVRRSIFNKNCKYCGGAFTTSISRQNYCSNEHRLLSRRCMLKKICLTCAVEFETSNNKVDYCKNHRSEVNGNIVICAFCKSPFTTTKSNKKFCNNECLRDSRNVAHAEYKRSRNKNIKNLAISKDMNTDKVNCVICCEPFKQNKSWQKTCSEHCRKLYEKQYLKDYKSNYKKDKAVVRRVIPTSDVKMYGDLLTEFCLEIEAHGGVIQTNYGAVPTIDDEWVALGNAYTNVCQLLNRPVVYASQQVSERCTSCGDSTRNNFIVGCGHSEPLCLNCKDELIAEKCCNCTMPSNIVSITRVSYAGFGHKKSFHKPEEHCKNILVIPSRPQKEVVSENMKLHLAAVIAVYNAFSVIGGVIEEGSDHYLPLPGKFNSLAKLYMKICEILKWLPIVNSEEKFYQELAS